MTSDSSTTEGLGLKRHCPAAKCGVPFYDLWRDPAICPVCGHQTPLAQFCRLKSSKVGMRHDSDSEADDFELEADDSEDVGRSDDTFLDEDAAGLKDGDSGHTPEVSSRTIVVSE